MATEYLDFDLQFRREGDQYRAAVLRSPAGEGASVSFTPPCNESELEQFLAKVGQARHRTRGRDSNQTNAVREFGEKLFSSIFKNDVLTCLNVSLSQAKSQNSGLRIRLRMNEATELADLPWEYLYSREANTFLALDENTPIVRYLELTKPIDRLTVKGPLRVLVAVSSPSRYAELDAQDEYRRLFDATKKWRDDGSLVIELLEHATLANLHTRLQEDQVNVLHFIGHGEFDEESKTGLLVFEDEKGNARRVSGESLAVLLGNHRSIRLVVLNACEGARPSREDPFAGIAHSLLQKGLPAAIAMQFEITDQAARVFSGVFYGAIVRGYGVDSALVQARTALYVNQLGAEWGTPVLFMRSPDGQIFDLTQSPPKRKWRLWETSIVVPRGMLSPVVVGTLVFSAALAFLAWRHFHQSLKLPRLAVMALSNTTGNPEYDWLSTSFADALSDNFSNGSVTVIPRDDVSTVQMDIAIPARCSPEHSLLLSNEWLSATYVVFGSFALVEGSSPVRVRVRACMQAPDGRVYVPFERDISLDGDVKAAQDAASQFQGTIESSNKVLLNDVSDIYPKNEDARRLYFDGVAKLRTFKGHDAVFSLSKAAPKEDSNPLIHSVLADAWSMLRHDIEAKTEAQKAHDLLKTFSGRIPLSYSTEIESRWYEINEKWDSAIDGYRKLLQENPERLDYGIKLASLQIKGHGGREAIATLDKFSNLAAPVGNDPRILLVKARAQLSLSQYQSSIANFEKTATLANQRHLPLVEANALLDLCWAYQKVDSYKNKVIKTCNDAQSRFTTFGDDVSAYVAYNHIATWLTQQERYPEAKQAYDRVIAILSDTSSKDLAGALLNSARVSIFQGDDQEAQRLLERSKDLSKAINDYSDQALAQILLSEIYRNSGNISEAIAEAESGRQLAHTLGDQSAESYALSKLALAQSENGDLKEALDNYTAILRFRENSESGNRAAPLMQIGEVYFRIGDFKKAEDSFTEATNLLNAQQPLEAAQGKLNLAELALHQDQLAEAEAKAGEARDVFTAKKQNDLLADALSILARVQVARGQDRLSQAEATLAQAKALQAPGPNVDPDPDIQPDIDLAEGGLLTANGKSADAVGILQNASNFAERNGRRFMSLQLRLALVKAFIASSQRDNAKKELAGVRKQASQCSKQSSNQGCGFALIISEASVLESSIN